MSKKLRERGRAARPRSTRAAASPPPSRALDPGAEGGLAAAALALWGLLAALTLARALATLTPGMWVWSLNLPRFLDPLSAWLPWALCAATLVPAVARRLLAATERLGDALARAPARSALVAAVLAAGMVLALPDRVRFVGDFLLRLNTLDAGVPSKDWYPQALPLDLWIHVSAAHVLMLAMGLDALGAARLIGALDAALLAALAVLAPSAFGARGAAAAVGAALVFWGGGLTLFTGYNKGFAEMGLVTVAIGVLGVRALREDRGWVVLGLAGATAALLHRSAVLLLPALVAAPLLAEARTSKRSAVRWAALALPAVAFLAMAPRVAHILATIDPMHLTPDEVRRRGLLAATFAGARPLDMVNLAVLLAPLAIPALGAAAALLAGPGRRALSRREALIVTALVVPAVASTPFVHPGQGYWRDWDDFAVMGAALAVASAWLAAGLLGAARRWAWLAVPVTLCAAMPTLQWLIHHRELDHGLARVRAFLVEPPPRPDMERYTQWQFLGLRAVERERYREAAEAYERAAAVIPSPSILRQWAIARSEGGDLDGARTVYRTIVTRNPDDVTGWMGLAATSSRLGDREGAIRALQELLRLNPDDLETRRTLERLQRGQASRPAAR